MGACVTTSTASSVANKTSQKNNGNMADECAKELFQILSKLSNTNRHITVSTLPPSPFGVIPGGNGRLVHQLIPYQELGMLMEFVSIGTVKHNFSNLEKLSTTKKTSYSEYLETWIKVMHAEICRKAKESCIKMGGDGVYGVNISTSEDQNSFGMTLTGTCIQFNRNQDVDESKDDNENDVKVIYDENNSNNQDNQSNHNKKPMM